MNKMQSAQVHLINVIIIDLDFVEAFQFSSCLLLYMIN